LAKAFIAPKKFSILSWLKFLKRIECTPLFFKTLYTSWKPVKIKQNSTIVFKFKNKISIILLLTFYCFWPVFQCWWLRCTFFLVTGLIKTIVSRIFKESIHNWWCGELVLTEVLKIFPSSILLKQPLTESNNLSKNKQNIAVSWAFSSKIFLAGIEN